MGGSANFAVQQLVERARVHPSTARRWIRSGRRPWWLQALLDCAGNLGILAQPWEGWSVHKDILRSPEGELFKPADLRALRVMRGQLDAYRAAMATHLQADWIEGRYVEDICPTWLEQEAALRQPPRLAPIYAPAGRFARQNPPTAVASPTALEAPRRAGRRSPRASDEGHAP